VADSVCLLCVGLCVGFLVRVGCVCFTCVYCSFKFYFAIVAWFVLGICWAG